MRDCAAVTGVGETAYTRGSGRTALALSLEAALAAVQDAGLSPPEIDGVVAMGGRGAIAEDVIANFGIGDLRLSLQVPMGGASPAAALQSAAAAVATGICRHVLLLIGRDAFPGSRVATRVHAIPAFRTVGEFELPLGAVSPAQLYAPMARRHMTLYGTTTADFAEIAVTTRRHAALNDRALMTKPITAADHAASRMISDPFRLLDCSQENDGGAAVVVSAADAVRRTGPRVALSGMAEGHPDSPASITQRDDMTRFGVAKAAGRAFAMAGVGPADIQVAAIYDCFTFVVLCQLEDLGFCAKGEGGRYVREAGLGLDSRMPVNTHGGLLSQAHMAGMNHVVELVRQLRGQAGRAQVAGAEIGLVTGYGDMGDGAVAIMRRAE
ncbi:MAG: transporter [Pseudomonadota bacterium]|nr:transporter [Pseudomonadota bacterium]